MRRGWTGSAVMVGVLVTAGALVLDPGKDPDRISDFTEAMRLGSSSSLVREHGVAAAYFERAIELNPDHASAWMLRARAVAESGRYGEAYELFLRAADFPQQTAQCLYRAARIEARIGTRTGALRTLARSVEAGFGDLVWERGQIMEDPAFERFRGDPVFEEILRRATNTMAMIDAPHVAWTDAFELRTAHDLMRRRPADAWTHMRLLWDLDRLDNPRLGEPESRVEHIDQGRVELAWILPRDTGMAERRVVIQRGDDGRIRQTGSMTERQGGPWVLLYDVQYERHAPAVAPGP